MTHAEAEEFWEQRYAEADTVWSGKPNQALVDVVGALPAGRALDLGCGEGGDSIWLAQQGWQVTGVDISPTALRRARAAARSAGVPEDDIRWVSADLATWAPDESYDLVSACFLHSPVEFPRTEVLRRAAGAVASGGLLLLVGHAQHPPWAREHRGHDEREYLTAEEELARLALPQPEWSPEIAEVRARDAVGPDGKPARLDDAILLMRRR